MISFLTGESNRNGRGQGRRQDFHGGVSEGVHAKPASKSHQFLTTPFNYCALYSDDLLIGLQRNIYNRKAIYLLFMAHEQRK